MKLIAHRGNLTGPDTTTENTWASIRKCDRLGIDVEIDFWVKENRLHIGHDEHRTEEIAMYQLRDLSVNVYAHCKNLDALQYMSSNRLGNVIPFSHDSDDFIALSNGEIWAHPRYLANIKVKTYVIAMVWGKPIAKEFEGFYAVCTDYPLELL